MVLIDRSVAHGQKLLKGAKQSDLSLEQPTKFEPVQNLKYAKAMGVTFP